MSGFKSSICADCVRCVGLCSWSAKFVPIPGWDADVVLRRNTDGTYTKGFNVKSCPLFTSESRESTYSERLVTSTHKNGAWSNRDKEFFKENLSTMSDDELSVILQRSVASVRNMKRRFIYVEG